MQPLNGLLCGTGGVSRESSTARASCGTVERTCSGPRVLVPPLFTAWSSEEAAEPGV